MYASVGRSVTTVVARAPALGKEETRTRIPGSPPRAPRSATEAKRCFDDQPMRPARHVPGTQLAQSHNRQQQMGQLSLSHSTHLRFLLLLHCRKRQSDQQHRQVNLVMNNFQAANLTPLHAALVACMAIAIEKIQTGLDFSNKRIFQSIVIRKKS